MAATGGGGVDPVKEIEALPFLVVSCTDVAVTVAVELGTNMPVEEIESPLDELHVTAGLKLPVPVTVAVQVEVCEREIDAGLQATVTDVMVDGGVET